MFHKLRVKAQAIPIPNWSCHKKTRFGYIKTWGYFCSNKTYNSLALIYTSCKYTV